MTRKWKLKEQNLAPGRTSWTEEYKRLYYHTPVVESEVLQHEDEVWHISFAKKAEMFATCCKSGYVKVSMRDTITGGEGEGILFRSLVWVFHL